MSVEDAIARLQAKARPLEERLNRIHIAIAELKELSSVAEVEKTKRTRVVVESRSATVRRSIADALFNEGVKMHRKELMAQLQKEGLYPGEAPQKELRDMASQLSVDPRFEKVSEFGSGYWRLTDIGRVEMSRQTDAAAGLIESANKGPIVVNPGQATIMPVGGPYELDAEEEPQEFESPF